MPSLNSILNNVFGSSNDRKLKKFNTQVDAINQLEAEYEKLNDAALKKSLENTEKKNKESFTPLKDYGGPVAMRRVSYPIDSCLLYTSPSPRD